MLGFMNHTEMDLLASKNLEVGVQNVCKVSLYLSLAFHTKHLGIVYFKSIVSKQQKTMARNN